MSNTWSTEEEQIWKEAEERETEEIMDAVDLAITETPSLGALTEALWEAREKQRKLQKQLDALVEEREDLERRLIAAMDAQGSDQTRSTHATATISESVKPNVEDWDTFWAFIHRNKAYYLLERRPAAVAYRELMERRRKPIPGVTSFIKRSINLRNRSTT